MAGGYIVTLAGTELGTGPTDLLEISLAGVAVTAVTWSSSTSVRAMAASVGSPISGPIVFATTACGNFSGQAFTYFFVRFW